MPAEWPVRRARPGDLDAIVALEQAAFQPWRQSSRASLRRSLHSRRQSVWVVESPVGAAASPGRAGMADQARGSIDPPPRAHPHQPSPAQPMSHDAPAMQPEGRGPLAACLVLWHHPRTLRVYGIATHPDMQGQGVGRALMRHAEALARRDGTGRIVLEADAQDRRLLDWYAAQGFQRVQRLPGFYAPGKHAWRLEKPLPV